MAYIAIKNFEVQGQSFKIGDKFPDELFEDRLLRAKKIEISGSILTEIKEVKKVEEPKEELLIEDSSDIEIIKEDEKPSKKSKK